MDGTSGLSQSWVLDDGLGRTQDIHGNWSQVLHELRSSEMIKAGPLIFTGAFRLFQIASDPLVSGDDNIIYRNMLDD